MWKKLTTGVSPLNSSQFTRDEWCFLFVKLEYKNIPSVDFGLLNEGCKKLNIDLKKILHDNPLFLSFS
jgi:hypothetical protein